MREPLYYGIDGVRYGPVTWREIRDLVEQKRLRPTDFLWDVDTDSWVSAADVGGLFDPAELNAATAADLEEGGADTGAGGSGGWTPHWSREPQGTTATADWPEGETTAYAGPGVRLVAYAIDVAVLIVPHFAVFLLLSIFTGTSPWEILERDGWLKALQSGELLPFELASFCLTGVYSAILESSAWQATLGKRLMGIIVTDTKGYRLTFFHALLRYLAKLLSRYTFGLGYLMIALTSRHQGLHDMAARTFCIRVQ